MPRGRQTMLALAVISAAVRAHRLLAPAAPFRSISRALPARTATPRMEADDSQDRKIAKLEEALEQLEKAGCAEAALAPLQEELAALKNNLPARSAPPQPPPPPPPAPPSTCKLEDDFERIGAAVGSAVEAATQPVNMSVPKDLQAIGRLFTGKKKKQKGWSIFAPPPDEPDA